MGPPRSHPRGEQGPDIGYISFIYSTELQLHGITITGYSAPFSAMYLVCLNRRVRLPGDRYRGGRPLLRTIPYQKARN